MTEKNKLGQASAFAFKEVKESVGGIPVNWTNHMGISKRFYAACAAMQGILAGKYEYSFEGAYPVPKPIPSYIAQLALECADELLKQENQ